MEFSNKEVPLLLKDKANLVGLEIGVERGNGAFHFLSNCDIECLYLVEPYLPYTDLDGLHVCDEICQRNNKISCINLLSSYSNFKLIEKKSDDAVNEFEDESLDFIFIDGLHTYEQCLRDMENYYPKLKIGGLFSGHDYNYISGVHKAVTEFRTKLNKDVNICEKDVWYWIK